MSTIALARPLSWGHVVGVVAGAVVFAANPTAQSGLLAAVAVVLGITGWALLVRARGHATRSDVAGLRTRRERRIALRHGRQSRRWRIASHSVLMSAIVIACAAALRGVLTVIAVA